MSATMTQESYHTVLEMAADAGETPLRYMVVELGWNEEDARKELIEAENKYLAY